MRVLLALSLLLVGVGSDTKLVVQVHGKPVDRRTGLGPVSLRYVLVLR